MTMVTIEIDPAVAGHATSAGADPISPLPTRTLLEAENSRLQTPGRGSQASLGFLGKRRSQLLSLEDLP